MTSKHQEIKEIGSTMFRQLKTMFPELLVKLEYILEKF